MNNLSEILGRPMGAFSQQFPGTPTEQAAGFLAHGLDCVQWQPGTEAFASDQAARHEIAVFTDAGLPIVALAAYHNLVARDPGQKADAIAAVERALELAALVGPGIGVSGAHLRAVASVTLPFAMTSDLPSPIHYHPPEPRHYRPPIGLIGCGGITSQHLKAAKSLGVPVVAFADVNLDAARSRRDEFYPEAEIYDDPLALLARPEIEVVDIAAHPAARVPLIRKALEADKHVLSQKPFVLELSEGRELADLADRLGLKLAVNQNGRWAPYFGHLLAAVEQGLIGEVQTADFLTQWNHTWVADTPFEKIPHVILYDFSIHWFDIVTCLFRGRDCESVSAYNVITPGQTITAPMAANTIVKYRHGLATLGFSGHAIYANQETLTVVGTKGLLHGFGPAAAIQRLTLTTAEGVTEIPTPGVWFPDGFRGAMGELLSAIEDGREPTNGARGNLDSLALCFAAMKSADTGLPQVPERSANF